MEYLLVAVLTSIQSGGMTSAMTPRGYQIGVMQKFDNLEHCKAAAQQLKETYVRGNYRYQDPDRGHIRCVHLNDPENTVVEIKI